MDPATKAERSAQVHGRDAEEEKGGRSTEVGEEEEEEEEEDLVPVVSTYLAPRAAGSLGFQQLFS
jgi:hypothetical protein